MAELSRVAPMLPAMLGGHVTYGDFGVPAHAVASDDMVGALGAGEGSLERARLRGDQLTWREIDGELVLLDMMSSTYFTTNRTGTFLLQLLTEQRSVDELCKSLADACDIPTDQVSADVNAFVASLRDRGLLEKQPADDST